MEPITVAVAQQQMRLFAAAADHRRELMRFMQMAQAKGAQLAVFPPLTGILAAGPLLDSFRMRLLKRAAPGRTRGSVAQRASRAMAGSAAGLLKAGFRQPYLDLLFGDPGALAAAHAAVYGELARAYEMTIVAGSAYAAAGEDAIRHRALVFGPDGAILGWHDRVMLSDVEADWVAPGEGWLPVATPAGRLGLLYGEEACYPEAGRLLAPVSDLLVVLAAGDDVAAAEVRLAAAARAQENRTFVLTSFPVGPDMLAGDAEDALSLAGRSGIYAPLAMTPRLAGALVEIGAGSAEGLLTAELDFAALEALRARDPLRKGYFDGEERATAGELPAGEETLLLPEEAEAYSQGNDEEL
jgi:predicted amidohydrolase